MKINLMVLSAGKSSGQTLPINVAQFIIGRDPECNLRPASAMISKRHCAVIVKNEQVSVRDFDSTNGTFVNEQQIKGEVPLKDGDLLKVGPLSFKVVIESKPALSKPTPPPKPRTADAMDDDAAAALLSFDDDLGSAASSETSEDGVPGGSTVMDMPAFAPPAPSESSAAAAKPAEEANPNEKKKPDTKAKHATGAAQDAAKAILAKLKSGRRGAAPEKP
jgi:pSer/pThr/pTyr-binding forkhead associated (FHA) protein